MLASHPCFFNRQRAKRLLFLWLWTEKEAFRRRDGAVFHIIIIIICIVAFSGFFCVYMSVCLYLANSCVLLSLFLSLSVHPLLASIPIKSEMFLLLMHTNAQRLTGADSMKRGAAEINTYVMKEKEAPNGSPICVCQRLSEGSHRHIHPDWSCSLIP